MSSTSPPTGGGGMDVRDTASPDELVASWSMERQAEIFQALMRHQQKKGVWFGRPPPFPTDGARPPP
eukprot:1380243-Prorocentrum_lima.AAC.1